MQTVLNGVMLAGMIFGGIMWLLDKESVYGKSFEQAIDLMGPLLMSMAGLICLAPAFSHYAGPFITRALCFLHVDPAMMGGLLPIDMGGFQIAGELARAPEVGRYAGVVVASIFGTTMIFTLPVAYGILGEDGKDTFSEGIMIGLLAMPVSLILGGLTQGLSFSVIVRQNVPIFVLALLLFVGMHRWPRLMGRLFDQIARVLKFIGLVGLILAAIHYLMETELVPHMGKLEDAMMIILTITLYLMGSLPLSHILYKMLRKPLTHLALRMHVHEISLFALVVGAISVVPGLVMLKEADETGRRMNAACYVSAASAFSAHLAFTLTVAPGMVPTLLMAKAVGGLIAALLAWGVHRLRLTSRRTDPVRS